MFLKNTHYFFYVLLAMLSSCTSQRQREQVDVPQVTIQNVLVDNLVAESLDIEMPGLLDVVYLDNTILFRTRDPQHLFYSVDRNSLEVVATFGKKGQGPKEFLYPRDFTWNWR